MQSDSLHAFSVASIPRPKPRLLLRYERYLKEVRGVRELKPQLCTVGCFLAFLKKLGIAPARVSKREIDLFISEQGRHYTKRTVASIASFLRAFFRYLAARGVVGEDLARFVERPRVVREERDPRFLKTYQVKQVLDDVDRSTLAGKRDYALLMLLASYGLRSCEIQGIRLEDIHWKAGKLAIRHRKCGDTIELPLLPHVAAALVEYLRVRPQNQHRHLFLNSFKPFRPLDGSGIAVVCQRALRHADITVARPGSHTFRYSHAQALFQAETPLFEIASILGHRDYRTTLGYLHIAVHPLREVALNEGEDLL